MSGAVGELNTQLGERYLQLMHEVIASTAAEKKFSDTPAYLHWPYIGSRYRSAARRVLFVGRAARGGEERTTLPKELPDGGKVDALLRHCVADREPAGDAPSCTEWYYTTQAEGLALRNRSYFWKLLRSASQALSVMPSPDEDPFPYFAWSNLFKLAPRDAGNPPDWMQKIEFAEGRAQALLQQEIDALDPDVVIFITGHTWMHWFWWEGSPHRLKADWEPDADGWLEQPVHRVGYQAREGAPPRLLIAVARPELRTRNVALARQVAPALEERLRSWAASHPLR